MIADAKARRETGSKEFNCEQCEYKSGSTTLLMRHKESVHMTNGNKGEKQIRKEDSPTQHTESVQRTVYQRDQCDYKSHSTTTLNSHKMSVHKKNCDKGEKQGLKEDSPTQHKESVQETEHQCEQCEYKSQSTANLKIHMSSAHKRGYVPKRKHCEHCDKKFNKSETFKKHTKEVHNREENSTQENPSKSNDYNPIVMAFQRQLRSKKNG